MCVDSGTSSAWPVLKHIKLHLWKILAVETENSQTEVGVK